MLLVATARSGVHAWDLRNHKPAFSLPATPQHVRNFHIVVALQSAPEAIITIAHCKSKSHYSVSIAVRIRQ